jgi:putative ABC transport system permease protein
LTAAALDSEPSAEAGIWTSGNVADWEMDIYGLRVDSTMIDPHLTDGAWLEDAGDAVVSAGFADRTGIEVGDPIEVVLAAGSADFVVTGLSDDSSRAIYVERQRLSEELGEPGMANIVWSADAAPTIDTEAPLAVTTLDEIVAEDAAGTNAIVVIFGAIGVLVSSVAALAVLSSMTVSLFERRHEFAALQAFGARKRRLRGLLFRELLPLGVVGVGVGLVIGALGARGIIASFEASNAIDIGVTDATAAVPFIVLGTAAVLALLVTTVVRSAARRPIAVSLRGAA